MWFEIARSTFVAQMRRPVFLLVTLACAVVGAYFASSSASPVVGGWGAINTPTSVAFILATMSNAVSVFAVLFVVGPILRDWDSRMSAILFTTQTTPSAYLMGRAISGVLLLHVLLLATLAGIALAPWMPWASSVEVSPFRSMSALWSVVVFVTPNALFTCAVFLFFAVLTQSIRSTFIAVIVVWLLWVLSGLAGNTPIGLYCDPFGSRALYQSVIALRTHEELLTALPYLTPVLLTNRIIWLAVSIIFFALAWTVFRKTYTRESRPESRIGSESKWKRWRPNTVGSALLLENTAFVVRSVPAMVGMAIALLFLWNDLATLVDPFSIPTLPVTGHLLDAQAGTFRTILMVFAVFAAGELVYREVTARMDGIAWALPASPMRWIAAKGGALFLVVVAWQCIGALLVALYASMFEVVISWKDFTLGTAMNTVPVILFALVAIALQYAAGRKYVGFVLCALLAATYLIPDMDSVSAALTRFADVPRIQHSDVVGFGGQFPYWACKAGYWGAVTLAICLGALAVATRRATSPIDDADRHGLKRMLTLWSGVSIVAACGVGVVFVRSTVGVWQQTEAGWVSESANHEKTLAYFLGRPQPSIEQVTLRVRFDGKVRAFSGDGVLRLKNTSTVEIPEVLFDAPRHALFSLDVNPSIATKKKVGEHSIVLQLRQAMPPGGTLEVPVRVDLRRAFPSDDGGLSAVQAKSAFLASEELLPCIGYDVQKDLRNSEIRKDLGLSRVPAPQGRGQLNERYLGCGRAFATLDLTLVGPDNLQAVTTGRLAETKKHAREASFHYRSDHPVPAYFSVSWGVWQKQSMMTRGGTAVEVFGVPAHAEGAKRLAQTAKEALEFYESHYGAYVQKQFRIVEVSRFVPGPRSFPGMAVMPETIGFTTDYHGGWNWGPPKNHRFDVPRWTMAHEVAHQWWGIGLLPSRAPGSQFLVESLAQYSAFRFLESEKVDDAKQAVSHEVSDYFMLRSRFSEKEPSLASVTNQPIVAYRKGLLALVATYKLAGSEHVDETLRSWYAQEKGGYMQPILAMNLIRPLLASAPSVQQPYLSQLFTDTVVSDAALEEAKSERQPDGTWKTLVIVTVKNVPERKSVVLPLVIELTRDDASSGGASSIRIGRKMFSLTSGRHTVELVSRIAPQNVEVDSDFFLVDPDRNNNRRAVTVSDGTRQFNSGP